MFVDTYSLFIGIGIITRFNRDRMYEYDIILKHNTKVIKINMHSIVLQQYKTIICKD